MNAAHPAELQCRFPAEPCSAQAARRELEALCSTLDDGQSSVLALLVTELIANGVQHGDGRSGAGIGLDVRVTDEVVRVRVTDGGEGFVARFRSADSPLDSQWGLYLLDELADRWEANGKPSTAVSFELDREPVSGDGPVSDGGRLSDALAEEARLADAYQQAIGTSSEMASYLRLQAAHGEVSASAAAAKAPTPG